jgi:hypothetical protein
MRRVETRRYKDLAPAGATTLLILSLRAMDSYRNTKFHKGTALTSEDFINLVNATSIQSFSGSVQH